MHYMLYTMCYIYDGPTSVTPQHEVVHQGELLKVHAAGDHDVPGVARIASAR